MVLYMWAQFEIGRALQKRICPCSPTVGDSRFRTCTVWVRIPPRTQWYTRGMAKHIKYTKELLEEAARNSTNVSQVLDYLGLRRAGGTHYHVSNKLKSFGIDTSHFTGRGWSKGKAALNRRTPDEVLVLRDASRGKDSTKALRTALIAIGREEVCACGVGKTWNGKKFTLEIDHINGRWEDNRRENLRFICPNCHSQEETTNRPHKFRGK